MSGHSKWANIKHKKAKADAQKGRVFTKIAKEIIIAVRQGGPDPDANFKLRMVLQKAKANNMPSDNIQRTIKKASGEDSGSAIEEMVYEGYGPGGVAILLELATDNRNRTAADIRHIFARRGGNLGETGCVAWMFDQKGRILVSLEEAGIDEDSLMMAALEAGAADMQVSDGEATILTEPGDLESVQTALSDQGIKVEEAAVVRIPRMTTRVEDEKEAGKLLSLIEELEDNDDVSAVYANYDIDDELLERIAE